MKKLLTRKQLSKDEGRKGEVRSGRGSEATVRMWREGVKRIKERRARKQLRKAGGRKEARGERGRL